MTTDKDYLGAMVSLLCLIHCLLPAMLLMLGVSSAGLAFLNGELIHYVLVLPIVLIAVWSIPMGFKRHHHRLPVVLAATGICALIMGLLFTASEVILTTMASCLLISAHLFNKKLLSKQVSQSI